MDHRPEQFQPLRGAASSESPTLAIPRDAIPSDQEREWVQGTILNGQYEIVEEVSRGAWGTVWRAWQPRIERTVAIKRLISRDERGQKAARARFEREAKLASKIRDPNAVRIIDYGHDGPTPYLVMEWIDGVTLADAIAAWSPLPTDLIETIGLRVASALDSAHQCGIIHRDLKPSNIMMVETSHGLQPIVIDFGLARTFSPDEPTVTRADVVIGTPAYMSPEAIVGQEISPASDLYSLGVILAEATLGSNPFRGKTSAESMTLHLQPPTFSQQTLVVHGASEAFANIIMNLLKSSPDERPSSASELVAAIEGLTKFPSSPLPRPRSAKPARPEPYETTSTRAIVANNAKTSSKSVFSVGALTLLASALCAWIGWQSLTNTSPAPPSPDAESRQEESDAPKLAATPQRTAAPQAFAQSPSMASRPESAAESDRAALVHSSPEPLSPTISDSLHDPPSADMLTPSAGTGASDPGSSTSPASRSTASQAEITPAPAKDVIDSASPRTNVSPTRASAPAEEPRAGVTRANRTRSEAPNMEALASLVVTSLPASEITVDGKYFGTRTNVIIRDLPAGEVQITARFEGETSTRTTRLKPGQRSVEGFRFSPRD